MALKDLKSNYQRVLVVQNPVQVVDTKNYPVNNPTFDKLSNRWKLELIE